MYTASDGKEFQGKKGIYENDFGALFRFALNIGQKYLKSRDFSTQGESIKMTYETHFKGVYDDPIHAIFDIALEAMKNKEIKEKLGITTL
jgi:hypothetical protein